MNTQEARLELMDANENTMYLIQDLIAGTPIDLRAPERMDKLARAIYEAERSNRKTPDERTKTELQAAYEKAEVLLAATLPYYDPNAFPEEVPLEKSSFAKVPYAHRKLGGVLLGREIDNFDQPIDQLAQARKIVDIIDMRDSGIVELAYIHAKELPLKGYAVVESGIGIMPGLLIPHPILIRQYSHNGGEIWSYAMSKPVMEPTTESKKIGNSQVRAQMIEIHGEPKFITDSPEIVNPVTNMKDIFDEAYENGFRTMDTLKAAEEVNQWLKTTVSNHLELVQCVETYLDSIGDYLHPPHIEQLLNPASKSQR